MRIATTRECVCSLLSRQLQKSIASVQNSEEVVCLPLHGVLDDHRPLCMCVCACVCLGRLVIMDEGVANSKRDTGLFPRCFPSSASRSVVVDVRCDVSVVFRGWCLLVEE